VKVQLHSFLTLALDRGGGQPHTPIILPQGKVPPEPTEYEGGRVQELNSYICWDLKPRSTSLKPSH